MIGQFARILQFAAALSLGLVLHAQSGVAEMRHDPRALFGLGMVGGYSYRQWECEKTGWGITECPDYGKKPSGETMPPRYGQPPPVSYEQPVDECTKTGWGTPECPNYGKKPAEESSGAAGPGSATPYQKPLDDCMKTGWGITECPNYGKKVKPE